ncbi:peptide chain release factor N(5)-glutamine methyltransferase [Alloscardovia omnicolens]|uniref:peptide chain release factor N(5)-glutamine methyltransferase n=1 Tax=Alloscardovia omnicolens TaxID=419015 RepID=UPI003A69B722
MLNFTDTVDVRTVISQCAQVLCDAGVADDAVTAEQQYAIAQHEVQWLLSEAVGQSISNIQAASIVGRHVADFASPEQLHTFRQWISRRIRREPLQHIVGHAPFRFLELAVGPGVFIPRPETELLIDAALDFIEERKSLQNRTEPVRIVDLCAGSGALGLAAATEIPHSYVWAVELSEQAYAYASKNQQKNHVNNYELRLADATSAQTLQELNGTVDIVVSNPPYIPLKDIPEQAEARESDPDMALYGGSDDGLLIPSRVIQRASSLLHSGGLLVMEHDWQQGEATRLCAQTCGFSYAQTRADFAHKDRYLYAIKD